MSCHTMATNHKQDVSAYCKVIQFRGYSIAKINCVNDEFNLKISLYKMGACSVESACLAGTQAQA